MTELTLPRLGYGAANVGNLYRPISDRDAEAILHTAWDVGIRYFDTAPHYGLGLSEQRLGSFLRSKPRSEYVISTKVGRLLVPNPAGAGGTDLANDFAVSADRRREWDFTEAGIRRSLEESLVRTGLDRFDLLYLHDPERHDLTAGLESALPALVRLREEGAVTAVGVGSMSPPALAAAAASGMTDVLMVAGRHSLVDQSALTEVLPLCRANGVRVVAAAVFNSGLLAQDEPTADARFDYNAVPPELLARAQRIAAVCRDFGVPLPTAALWYPLQHDCVDSVVVGGSRPEQVRENANRLTNPPPAQLWRRLAEEGLIPS